MIISHKHKFIFIKPRKVAGTSIEVNLAKQCGDKDIITSNTEYTDKHDEDSYSLKPQNDEGFKQHSKPKSIRRKIGKEVWNNYYKITVVRNPWSMLVSRYEWNNSTLDRLNSDKPLANINKKALLKPRIHIKILRLLGIRLGLIHKKKDFHRFIEKHCCKQLNTEYYFDEKGKPLEDFYIRFEHLQKDYKKLCEKLNIPYERLPRLKTKSRKTRDYREYYNKRTKNIVAKKAKREIEFFNYRYQ